jgi:carboxymethylenebutenolidase
MMFRKFSITFWSMLLLLSACGGGQQSETAETESESDTAGMAQFADDESFKAAHGEPTELHFEGRGEMLSYPTPDGAQASAYLLKAPATTNKYLFVFHEWWGLNDHIKAEAERLYDILDSTVTVMAPDIYDGQIATTQEKASELMQGISNERAQAIIQGAINYAGENARIGTIGWCFGGGMSLNASILAGEKGAGCVMYYGMPVKEEKAIAPLSADILGIFARQDDWINEEVVSDFKQLCEETGKNLEVHWFDAVHAFANPSNPDFDGEAAQQANNLAWGFLEKRL